MHRPILPVAGGNCQNLDEIRINYTTITRMGRNKFLITFKNHNDANALAKDTRLAGHQYVAAVPWYKVFRKAILRGVPADISADEVIETINAENRELTAVEA